MVTAVTGGLFALCGRLMGGGSLMMAQMEHEERACLRFFSISASLPHLGLCLILWRDGKSKGITHSKCSVPWEPNKSLNAWGLMQACGMHPPSTTEGMSCPDERSRRLERLFSKISVIAINWSWCVLSDRAGVLMMVLGAIIAFSDGNQAVCYGWLLCAKHWLGLPPQRPEEAFLWNLQKGAAGEARNRTTFEKTSEHQWIEVVLWFSSRRSSLSFIQRSFTP